MLGILQYRKTREERNSLPSNGLLADEDGTVIELQRRYGNGWCGLRRWRIGRSCSLRSTLGRLPLRPLHLLLAISKSAHRSSQLPLSSSRLVDTGSTGVAEKQSKRRQRKNAGHNELEEKAGKRTSRALIEATNRL
jgi:hypothetical protein